MELLLWRWSTAAQVASVLMVTMFFVVAGRSTGHRETLWFAAAWSANLLALVVTLVFWFAQPVAWVSLAMKFGYFSAKTAFATLLIYATAQFLPGGRVRLGLPSAASLVLAYALVATVLTSSIDGIGVAQSAVVALLLGFSALLCWRTPGQGLGWLGLGLALRSLLALIETCAYALRALQPEELLPPYLGVFLAAHSSFDAAAEWMIALGCVLAIAHRVQSELRRKNEELAAAQMAQRELAERDPLTGLYNRRMLPQLEQLACERGATLLFFDLDDFKQINDRAGHRVGDQCLQRMGAALRGAFPDETALLRYAGDEFLLIAAERQPDVLAAAVAQLRQSLARSDGATPAIRFSVGQSELAAGASFETALHEADAAMYRDKLRTPPVGHLAQSAT